MKGWQPPIHFNVDERKERVRISCTGRFDFQSHKLFSKIIEDFNCDSRSVELDLSETTYMDSAALGLLLLLRQDGDRKVHIVAISDEARQPMVTARFDRLFELPKSGA